VRAVFLTLLVANLLFLAWARWIDTPSDAGAQDAFSRLPRLQLVTESPPGTKPTSANLTRVAAEKVAFHAPEASAGAVAAVGAGATAEAPTTCTSVGPFNDIARAARAAGLLTQRGFHLQQRAEEGDTIEGYWVFVGDLQSDDEVTQVVERLEKSGFADAHVMRNFSTNRRISVGMFSTRERAEKRAAAVRNLGLQPEIGERRFPGTVYWVDVALERGPGFKQLPPEYSFADIGHAKVAIQPCPAEVRPVEPGTPAVVPGDDGDRVAWRLPRTAVTSAPVRH
jgi:cell division septation protein DedD